MRDNEIATFEFYKEKGALFSDRTARGIYFFAQQNEDTTWSVVRRTLDYHHSWKRWVTFHRDETLAETVHRLPEAMEMLAKLEKEMQQEKGYEQKKISFCTHYRDYVSQLGDHIDESGRYVEARHGQPITVDAKMDSKELSELYKKAAERAEPTGIQTWKDFHREVTGKVYLYSKERFAAAMDADFEDFCEEMLAYMASLDSCVADDKQSWWTRRFAVDNVRGNDSAYEQDSVLEYHYFAMRLTALVRAGQKVYDAFMASPMTESHLQMLEYVADAVRSTDGARFGFTPEKAAQAVNLFTQGPDPRTGTPSPLEEVLALRNARRGKGPKPYSP